MTFWATSVHAFEPKQGTSFAHESGWSLSLDVLRFFLSQISPRAEMAIDKHFSLGISADFKAQFVPPGLETPGWKTLVSAGAEGRYYFTGRAQYSGFYGALGVSLGFQNSLDSMMAPIIASAALLHFYPFAFDRRYLKETNYAYLAIDPVIRVGHTWTVSDWLYFDVGGGILFKNVFALGKNGGFFYAAPLPILNATIGYRF